MTPKPGRLRDPSDNPTNAPLRMSWGRRNTRQANRQVKSLNSTVFGRLHVPFLHRLRVPRISETLPDVRSLRAVTSETAVTIRAVVRLSPVLTISICARMPQSRHIPKSWLGRRSANRSSDRYDRRSRKSLTNRNDWFTTSKHPTKVRHPVAECQSQNEN